MNEQKEEHPAPSREPVAQQEAKLNKEDGKQSSNSKAEPAGKRIREWAGVFFGLLGTLLAIVAFYQSSDAMVRAREAEDVANKIAIEQLLSEAWDLMGGRSGATVIFEFVDNPGDLELARRKIDEALLQEFNNAKGLRYKAVYLEAIGDLNGALETYQEAIWIDSTSAAAYINYGVALSQKRLFEQTRVAYLKAGELGGDEVLIQINLGQLYRDQGLESEAEAAFSKAEFLIANNKGIFVSEILQKQEEIKKLIRGGRFYFRRYRPRNPGYMR